MCDCHILSHHHNPCGIRLFRLAFVSVMADDQVKNVATAVVDEVINGVNMELNKVKDVTKGCVFNTKERSLLCVFFDPCKYPSKAIK